ncbi:unnamed protein product [Sphagnum balticum]
MTAMPPGTVQRDIFSWNAKLAQFVKDEAQRVFNKMPKRDVISWTAMLGGYSLHGHGKEALDQFEWMCKEGKAEDFIKMMSCESNVVLWMSLLGACRSHGNVEMGEVIAKRVLALDPGNSAEYVRSNIYTAAAKWNPPANVQHQKLERGMHLEYRGQ